MAVAASLSHPGHLILVGSALNQFVYHSLVLGQVPMSEDKAALPTGSYDRSGVSAHPYFSELINGKGRHIDVPYVKSRLSVFTVEEGKQYRFRWSSGQFYI